MRGNLVTILKIIYGLRVRIHYLSYHNLSQTNCVGNVIVTKKFSYLVTNNNKCDSCQCQCLTMRFVTKFLLLKSFVIKDMPKCPNQEKYFLIFARPESNTSAKIQHSVLWSTICGNHSSWSHGIVLCSLV